MYEKNLVTKSPTGESVAHHEKLTVTNSTWPPLVHMSKDLVPGAPIAIVWRWVWGMPEPADHMPRHKHSSAEVLFHVGNDPYHPEDLGGELEFTVGTEKLIINKTSALYIPGGVEHCPLKWHRVDRPHLQIALEVGGKYD